MPAERPCPRCKGMMSGEKCNRCECIDTHWRPTPCRTYQQAAACAPDLTRDEILALLSAREAPPKPLMAKYYKTPWFKALKASHIERTGHCMIWQAHTEGLTLHHNTYETLFAENDEHILVVCGRCHRKIHGKG